MPYGSGCCRVRCWALLVTACVGLATPAAFAQPTIQSPTPAPAAVPGRQAVGLVTAHAEARRRLQNTVSDAVVSIEVHGRDLRGTAAALARQSQTLLTFLRSQPTERLRTDGMRFDPEIQELRGQPDRIKGYTGRISVSFRTIPDALPVLLAGCLDNGATALGQFGSSPREQEVEAARREMVAEAGQGALAQARAIADAVGQRIAGVEFVDIDPLPGLSAGPALPAYVAERASRPAPPVQPIANEAGDSSFSVMVVMTLRLVPPD